MEAFDVVEDIESGLGMSLILASVDTLPFQHSEEALGCGIVRTAAGSAHRTGQVVANEESLVIIARELAASIRMKNHRLLIFTLPERHQYGLEHKVAVLATAHRPSDDDP